MAQAGDDWRKSDGGGDDRRFFNKRKFLYLEIYRRAKEPGMNYGKAVSQLEDDQAKWGYKSLSKLQEYIRLENIRLQRPEMDLIQGEYREKAPKKAKKGAA